MKKILLLPGDGIGPEVVAETEKLIAWFNQHKATRFVTTTELVGGCAYDKSGSPLPDQTLEAAKNADAILLGAVGGPKWESLDFKVRPERGLLGLRKELNLFANIRPALCFDALADASTLKREIIAGLDIVIIRELTGDLYFGTPRGVETLKDGTRKGTNTMTYTSPEVHRIARVAFELAMKRGKKVCSVDKANVLETTEMWREEVQKIRDTEYKDVALSHMYVDNAAMQLVRNPKQFDVMVTGNIFGDILSDIGAQLTGSLGMLPSASLGSKDANGKTPAMYEPVHGSAPDIAGKKIANPIATILSFSMMLRYSFGMDAESDLVENAVKGVLAKGFRTADIMQVGAEQVDTSRMGDLILEEMNELSGLNKIEAA